jgi:transcription initiation factor TFIIB
MDSQQPAKCPECGCRDIVEDPDSGEMVCSGCGLVLGRHALSERPEWKAWTTEEERNRSRVGLPQKLAIDDKGLSTTIDYSGRDAHGKPLSPTSRATAQSLQKWHRRTRVGGAMRSLSSAMATLDRLTDILHIPPSLKEQAALIYRRARGKALVRGRSRTAMVAAALYTACRISGNPRTLIEIASVAGLKKCAIAKSYRAIRWKLSLDIPLNNASKYISRIVNECKAPASVEKESFRILEEYQKKNIFIGKNPIAIAVGIVYWACRIRRFHITQTELAKISGMTEVTVRKHCKIIYQTGIVSEIDQLQKTVGTPPGAHLSYS